MGEDLYDVHQNVAPEMYLQFDLEISKLGGNPDTLAMYLGSHGGPGDDTAYFYLLTITLLICCLVVIS
jgi:hypothetical protein